MTFNEASFDREYKSIWSGTVENAFFNGEAFDRNRILRQPEYARSGKVSKASYYILAMDIARTKRDNSVIVVLKVSPQAQGAALKNLVNIYSFNDEHFEDQAIRVKKLFYKYNAKRLVVDANGPGQGFIDYLVKPQVDPDTGDILPDFGVYGGTTKDIDQQYKRFRTDQTEQDALYLVKANAAINTEAHTGLQSQLASGKIKLLIDERVAKVKLMGTKMGKDMTPEKRQEYLLPFTLTSVLREELLNLREENEGINIILKQANRTIRKDKVSALEYAIYYIRQEEENRKKKKRFDPKQWRFSSHL